MKHAIRFSKRHFGAKEWTALAASLTLVIFVTWALTKTGNLEELGYVGGFLAMLLGSATVILPAPGLAVVVTLGATLPNPLLVGIVAGAGATLGEITSYLAGYGGHKIIEGQKHYPVVERLVEKYGFWAIALLAFIPNPVFDVAGLIAGGTRYPFGLFLTATLVGKVAKCIVAAYAGATAFSWLFGSSWM
jgi:membrane protein DedA with SNARE-associated domain